MFWFIYHREFISKTTYKRKQLAECRFRKAVLTETAGKTFNSYHHLEIRRKCFNGLGQVLVSVSAVWTATLLRCVSRLQTEWAGLPQLHPLSARAGDVVQSLFTIWRGQDEVTVAKPTTSSEVSSCVCFCVEDNKSDITNWDKKTYRKRDSFSRDEIKMT